MGKSLAVLQKSCISVHVFWSKIKKYVFLREMVLIEVLYQIYVQLVIDWFVDFKKHQTLVLTKRDFYALFKISHF